MRYTVQIEIDQPVKKVVELFDNSHNMTKWMIGLQSFKTISGELGQPGTKSLLKFKMGKREIEMIETITVNNLPDEFSGTYEAKGVLNIAKNSFVSFSDNRTKYISKQEFRFKGFMKIIGFLMPSAFKKQTLKYMINFKNFAESQK